MNSNSSSSSVRLTNWYYSFAAMLLVVLSVIGFHHFYFGGTAYPGRPLTPAIKKIVISHAVVMSVWMLLAVLQPFLIALKNKRLHKRLGLFATLLAILVFILGVMTGVASTRVAPPDHLLYGLTPKQFMAIPLISVSIFLGFVVVGILNRSRPKLHKPMMLLATLSAVSAGIARIDPLNKLYFGTILEKQLSAFPMTIAVGIILLILKALIDKGFDRIMAIGLLIMALGFWMTTAIATTNSWEKFASALL